jgi:hypothetical protein
MSRRVVVGGELGIIQNTMSRMRYSLSIVCFTHDMPLFVENCENRLPLIACTPCAQVYGINGILVPTLCL